MLLRVYERLLERKIRDVPRHIMVVCPDIGEKFSEFVEWCKKFGIEEITVCVNTKPFVNVDGARIRYVENGRIEEFGEGNITLNIIAGYSGKDEIIQAIRRLAEKVAEGSLDPEDVDEEMLEAMLAVKSQPDMIIKVGNEIPEFLIWQSIYSELLFVDFDWQKLRYVDFLRALREFQRRERRYGR